MKIDTIQAGDFLRLSAQRFPDRDCFVFGDGSSRSFAETNRRVNQMAGALHRRGVRKGDRVAILATDSGEYVEVMMACMKLGVTYVPLNNRLADGEALTLLRRAEPKAVFASARYARRVAALARELTGVQFTAALDGQDLVPFTDLLAEGTDAEPGVVVDDEDILALAFTSGTTALPKGVLQSQRMINALSLQMSVDYQILLEEFRYSASPTFHIAGQAMIFMHVQRGFPTLILPQFAEDPVLRWMQSGRLTGVFLVPTMISRLLEDPRVHDSTYENLRSIIYGASPMSPDRGRPADVAVASRPPACRGRRRAPARLDRQDRVRGRPAPGQRGRQGRAAGRSRRDHHPQPRHHVRLPGHASGDRPGPARRLVLGR